MYIVHRYDIFAPILAFASFVGGILKCPAPGWSISITQLTSESLFSFRDLIDAKESNPGLTTFLALLEKIWEEIPQPVAG